MKHHQKWYVYKWTQTFILDVFLNYSCNISFQNAEAKVEEEENKGSPKAVRLTQEPSEENEVFGM